MLKFGTGGWRAIISDDFTRENVELVSLGISVLNRPQENKDLPIVIGFDNRFMGKDTAYWVSDALNGAGISTEMFENSIPTPLLMHYVRTKGLNYGIMISASHNPYMYNGIKLIVKEGRDAPIEVTNELCDKMSQIINGVETDYIREEEFQRNLTIIHNEDYYKTYMDSVLSIIDKDRLSRFNGKIAFNAMHGSSYGLFDYIMAKLGIQYDRFCCTPDPTFGYITPAPNESTMFYFKKYVVDNKCGIGIAFDGDGDRIGIVDSYGRYYDMNEMLCILYQYLTVEKHMHGPIVKNCVTTYVLDNMAKAYNEQCINVPVGFKWISNAMSMWDAILGGESSGGLTMKNHIHGKDSTFSALLILEMLSGSTSENELMERLKSIWELYGKSKFMEDSVKYTCEKYEVQKYIDELPNKFAELSVSNMDGIRLIDTESDSWVSVRFSGTEPIVRLMGEIIDYSNKISTAYTEILEDLKKFGE